MRMRDDDSALLSIDFLAGFTVFLLAFIVAASMVPGMLASLQSSSVDYDAVAYRTGVILAEDPGWFEDPGGIPGTNWQSEPDVSVKRMGLAVSGETPGILSAAKVDRFFDGWTVSDYRSKLFFSEYPYTYNISLKKIGEPPLPPVGAPLPLDTTDYGSIRRAVIVKENTPFCVNFTDHQNATADNTGNKTFSVVLNFTAMLAKPDAYQINPYEDTIMVRLEDPGVMAQDVDLSNLVLIMHKDAASTTLDGPFLDKKTLILTVDGIDTPVNTLPIRANDSITLTLEPGFFTLDMVDQSKTVDIQFTFNKTSPDSWQYLNKTSNYAPASTSLTPAVLEVAVW